MGILSATGALHTCVKDVVSGLNLFKEKLFMNDVFSVLPAQYAPQRNF